ncbi:MAG: accessory gene regulator B family protein [Lachnospiraceae bacterium]|nr:accessory gene regulator B family protein [Lachnospiraceae bacterium]
MITYNMLADRLISIADIDWRGREDQRNTCCYGLEMLLAFVVNCILVFLLGVVLRRLKEIFIYSVVWGSLRLSAGGRHADNHLRCIITYIASMLLVIYGGEYLAVNHNINIWIIFGMFAGFVVNAVYAGRHKKSSEEQKRNKKKTLMAWGAHFLFICYSMSRQMNGIQIKYNVFIILGAVLAESFFLLPIQKPKR